MPIYNYECSKCDHKFEFLKLYPEEKVECPQCSSPEEYLELDMESFKSDFVLRGKGWAKDRYGN